MLGLILTPIVYDVFTFLALIDKEVITFKTKHEDVMYSVCYLILDDVIMESGRAR